MRYFITHNTPRDYLIKYNIPTAGYNFSSNLISSGVFDKVYSLLPTNVFNYTEPLASDEMEIIYSKLRSKSFFSRVAASFIEQVRLFNRIEKKSCVWLYNITVVNILLFVLIRCFKPSVRVFTIVLDFTPEDKINKIILPLINSSNGLIKLADSPLFTVQNSICLPGVVNAATKTPWINYPLTNDFLISGNIKEQIAMISMLLEAFSQMPECTLHISGHAQNPSLIQKYADKYDNIIYYGNIEYKEYLTLLERCPFLLSTRDPREPRNQCNFPSKIMEGLLYNRIIISTIHYEQLNGINYIEVPADKELFMAAIMRITESPETELMTYANQTNLMRERFNSEVWKKQILMIENTSLFANHGQ